MNYIVYTPYYSRTMGSTLDLDPPEYVADVVDVEANTKREALIKGLQKLRRGDSYWVREMEGDLRNPFNGLKAQATRPRQRR